MCPATVNRTPSTKTRDDDDGVCGRLDACLHRLRSGLELTQTEAEEARQRAMKLVSTSRVNVETAAQIAAHGACLRSGRPVTLFQVCLVASGTASGWELGERMAAEMRLCGEDVRIERPLAASALVPPACDRLETDPEYSLCAARMAALMEDAVPREDPAVVAACAMFCTSMAGMWLVTVLGDGSSPVSIHPRRALQTMAVSSRRVATVLRWMRPFLTRMFLLKSISRAIREAASLERAKTDKREEEEEEDREDRDDRRRRRTQRRLMAMVALCRISIEPLGLIPDKYERHRNVLMRALLEYHESHPPGVPCEGSGSPSPDADYGPWFAVLDSLDRRPTSR
jgi:hypothetical protein